MFKSLFCWLVSGGGGLTCGGAYYIGGNWEFCISKWVGLDNKNGLKLEDNSLKQLTLTVHGLIFSLLWEG